MDSLPFAPAKPLFALTAVLYAGMSVILLTQGDDSAPPVAQADAAIALIESLPPTAAGPSPAPNAAPPADQKCAPAARW